MNEPIIIKDESNGTISISGISMMEDAMEFYKPIKEWANEFLSKNKSLIIDLINYFNSSSAKQFIQLISLLEEDSFTESNLEISQ